MRRRRGCGCLALLAVVVAAFGLGVAPWRSSTSGSSVVGGLGTPEVLNVPAGPAGPSGVATPTTPFPIPAFEPGKKCAFDYRAQISRLDPATGTVRWATDIPTSYADSGLLVRDGRLFFAAGGSIGAIEVATGRPLWWRPGGDGFLAVAWGDGVVLARSAEDVAGLDPATGRTVWSAGHGEVLPTGASPAVAGRLAAVQGRIVTRTGTTIRVLRAADGTQLAARTSSEFADGVPLLDGDLVILAGTTRVLGLRAATLDAEWEWTPGLHGSEPMTATPAADLLVVTTANSGGDGPGLVAALDPESGRLRWQRLVDTRVAAADVAGFPGWPVLLQGEFADANTSGGGSAVVLDVRTGATVWGYPAAKGSGHRPIATLVLAPPRAESGSLVAAYGSSVRRNAVADGARSWRTDVGFRPKSLLDGVEVTYVLGAAGESGRVDATGGRIAALDASGRVLWRTDLRDPAVTAVRDVSGDLLVHSEDERVFCD